MRQGQGRQRVGSWDPHVLLHFWKCHQEPGLVLSFLPCWARQSAQHLAKARTSCVAGAVRASRPPGGGGAHTARCSARACMHPTPDLHLTLSAAPRHPDNATAFQICSLEKSVVMNALNFPRGNDDRMKSVGSRLSGT